MENGEMFTPDQIRRIASAISRLPRYPVALTDDVGNVSVEASVLLDDLEQALIQVICASNTYVAGVWQLEVAGFDAEQFVKMCKGG